MKNKKKKNWAKNFRKLFYDNPLVIIFLIAALVLSNYFVIEYGFFRARDWYINRYKWQQVENEKINKIEAGMNIDQLYEIYGSPRFVDKQNGLIESIFKNRGYWVQAVSKENTVLFYSITVCDLSFHPEIKNVLDNKSIILGVSTLNIFDQAYNNKFFYPDYLSYFPSGGSADSHFFEGHYLANPGDYQSIIFGINDGCRNLDLTNLNYNDKDYDDLYVEYSDTSFSTKDEQSIKPEELINFFNKENVKKFRSTIPINTYSVLDSSTSLDEIIFYIGVDSIKIY